MDNNVKNVLIFGAGASFGSGDVNPKPPPMTVDLFAVLKRLFPPIWGGLSQEMMEVFTNDFEEGMRGIGKVKRAEKQKVKRRI